MSSKEAVEYFGGDELPASVWTDKYAKRNKQDVIVEQTPDDSHRRYAKEFARIEKKKFANPYSEEEIYGWMKDFGAIVPQGSPMYGIGLEHQYVSLSNCFVTDSPTDSYGGIMRTDQQMAQLCKRRGGVGTDLSMIRPDNMPTTNSARKATGVLPFMERFSNTIREVGQNGRRGALMLSISVHHPQVLDFAKVKLDPKKVTGANISVRLSDEFLKAVEADEEYEQRWPVDAAVPDTSRMVKARDVWQEIIKCAWMRAEPGLLFWDNIIKESPADCYSHQGFETLSTNPCGELPISALDSCRLLVVNLFKCVVNPYAPDAYFDFNLLSYYAGIAQRLMDNLVDLELEMIQRIINKVKSDPESDEVKGAELSLWNKVYQACYKGRRTGTGITALGDALAAVGFAYGSDESIQFVEHIYKELKLGAYRSSVEMSKELGPFPVYKHDCEMNNPFLLRIKDEDPKLYADMKLYGRRNISLLTTAPTGSTSILSNLQGKFFGTTSGIEPLFRDKPYTRRKKVNHAETVAKVDFIDENGDKWTHFDVYHSGIKMWMQVTGETDYKRSPYHKCCAEDINWRQRVKLQAAAQRHVDHSISSTVNLPNDVTEAQVAEIYEEAWRSGLKGITVYRDGCRDGVLVDTQPKKQEKFVKTNAVKRDKFLPCDIHETKVKGKKCTVIIGLYEGEPYEVFANLDGSGCTPLEVRNEKQAKLQKVARGNYQLVFSDETVSPLSECLTDEQAVITRLVSTALRHGTPIEFLVHQLEKVPGEVVGFAKAVSRVLKKYIKEGTKVSGETCPTCDSPDMQRREGCVTCVSCGYSKC